MTEIPTVRLYGHMVYDIRALLPHRPRVVGWRGADDVTSTTLHYNGPPVTLAPTLEAELAHFTFIAEYHIEKNWRTGGGLPAIHGDGMMYHFAFGPSGNIYWTRSIEHALWHCGDAEGNAFSLALHLPLGGAQVPTDPQWSSVTSFMDAYNAERGLRRERNLGHREWGTSECPGSKLFPMLKAWRAALELVNYRVLADGVRVREAPSSKAAIALGGKMKVNKGHSFRGDTVVEGEYIAKYGSNLWIHRADGIGFIKRELCAVAA